MATTGEPSNIDFLLLHLLHWPATVLSSLRSLKQVCILQVEMLSFSFCSLLFPWSCWGKCMHTNELLQLIIMLVTAGHRRGTGGGLQDDQSR